MGMSGIQQAIVAALKSAAENLPPEIQENILQVGQKVAQFQAQLDRLEQNQKHIISLLQTKGIQNGPEQSEPADTEVRRISGDARPGPGDA